MEAIWRWIEEWLSHNAPSVLQSLRGGATERDIRALESAFGGPLPGEYRESLLRHDGQVLDEFGCSPGFIYGLNLYPIAKAVSRWQGWSELLGERIGQDVSIETNGPVRPVWWDRLWIPIADDGNNNYCCLDLSPANGGQFGQVIQVWSQEHRRRVLAGSFRDWMTRFADELEAGGYVYSPAHNGLISLRDAIADGVV